MRNDLPVPGLRSAQGERAMLQPMIKVRQDFPLTKIEDVAAAVREEVDRCASSLTSGSSIAVAVGSRGIAKLETLVRETVSVLTARGMHPFIVPAMGSHGGATAEGQTDVLAGLGVSEDSVGAPIRSCMDVIELPRSESPVPVFMDRLAWEADGIVLINRVKPHTSFHADYESGLAKMMVVGIGKQKGALEIHRHGTRGLREYVPSAARDVLATGRILAGLAVVENADEDIATVRGLLAEDILEAEPALLSQARMNMPSLPCEDIHVLIVDELGKDISGTGMDPNIIGRLRIHGEPEPDAPRISMIVVTELSEGSHGNCYGIGLADVITRTVLDKADLPAMYANACASTFLERAKIPVTVDTPAEALALARRACGDVLEGTERVARIRNTLRLRELYVSPAIYAEIEPRVETLSDTVDAFQPDGQLVPF